MKKKQLSVLLSGQIYLYTTNSEKIQVLQYHDMIPFTKVASFSIPVDKQEASIVLFGANNYAQEIELVRKRYPLELTSSGNKIALELSYRDSFYVKIIVMINQIPIDTFYTSFPRLLYYV